MQITPQQLNIVQLDTSVIILACAVATYLAIQIAKRFFPRICGAHAVGLNVLLSALGAVLATHPSTWGAALALIFQTSGIAAGIHGTVSKLSAPGTGRTQDGRTASPGAAALAVLLCLFALPLAGCRHGAQAAAPAALPVGAVDTVDANANRILQTAHAFSARVTTDTVAGKLKLTVAQKSALGRFNAVLNVADTYLINYHDCGVARAANQTLPTCDGTQLQSYLNSVQEAFGTVELALTPVPVK